MKRFKLYIFDFDGTLINSYEQLFHFYNYILNPFGIKVDIKLTYQLAKESLEYIFKTLVKDESKKDEFIRLAYEVVKSGTLLQYVKIYDDAEELISYLHENKIESAITTGNSIVNVKMVLNHLNVKEFYKTIVTNEMVARPKPYPDPINKTLELLNYKGDLKDVCYVGDAINDYYAAKEAGVIPILIDRDDSFSDVKDVIVIKKLTELI